MQIYGVVTFRLRKGYCSISCSFMLLFGCSPGFLWLLFLKNERHSSSFRRRHFTRDYEPQSRRYSYKCHLENIFWRTGEQWTEVLIPKYLHTTRSLWFFWGEKCQYHFHLVIDNVSTKNRIWIQKQSIAFYAVFRLHHNLKLSWQERIILHGNQNTVQIWLLF